MTPPQGRETWIAYFAKIDALMSLAREIQEMSQSPMVKEPLHYVSRAGYTTSSEWMDRLLESGIDTHEKGLIWDHVHMKTDPTEFRASWPFDADGKLDTETT
jgi:hypothetical protein